MGSFNRRFIITEAENILEQCNINNTLENKTKTIKLKILNKRLKRKITFLRICNFILISLLIISII